MAFECDFFMCRQKFKLPSGLSQQKVFNQCEWYMHALAQTANLLCVRTKGGPTWPGCKPDRLVQSVPDEDSFIVAVAKTCL